MHASHLTRVRLHTTCRFSRLDVAPDHGGHVTLVIHEASIKVRSIIWIRGRDVREATGEWVLQEVEHSEEIAWRHDHMVTKPTSDDGIVHDRLVRLVFEVEIVQVIPY